MLDQRRARPAAAGRDLQHVLGQAALAQRFGHQERRQRRDLGGLEDHAVARRQRGNAVAEGVRERIVPGADHADQPERAEAQDQLLALHQHLRGLHALVGQVLARVLGPEAERAAPVGDLREGRVLVGLAGLGDDRRDDLLGVVHEPLLSAQQHARAAVEPERLPAGLRSAPARCHLGDGLRPEVGDGRDGLAGGGVFHRDVATALGVGADDLLDDVCFLDGGHLSLLFVALA